MPHILLSIGALLLLILFFYFVLPRRHWLRYGFIALGGVGITWLDNYIEHTYGVGWVAIGVYATLALGIALFVRRRRS